MDFRQTLALSASLGVAVASAASLTLAGRGDARTVASLDERIRAVSVHPLRRAAGPPVRVLDTAPPLFPVLSGAGAEAEVALRVDGLARTPGRVAALVSINGAPAAWMAVGETRDGVTLEAVGTGEATLDTARGERVVTLGQPAAGSASPAPAADPHALTGSDAVGPAKP